MYYRGGEGGTRTSGPPCITLGSAGVMGSGDPLKDCKNTSPVTTDNTTQEDRYKLMSSRKSGLTPKDIEALE